MVQSTGTADSETKIEIGTHLCTLEEWNAFYEPDERIKSNFLKMRQEGKVRCLDDNDKEGNPVDYNIYGENEN